MPSIDVDTFTDIIQKQIFKATDVIGFRVDEFHSKAFKTFIGSLLNNTFIISKRKFSAIQNIQSKRIAYYLHPIKEKD